MHAFWSYSCTIECNQSQSLTVSLLPHSHFLSAMLQFFTVVALPMYQTFCSVFPNCRPMLDAVKANYGL